MSEFLKADQRQSSRDETSETVLGAQHRTTRSFSDTTMLLANDVEAGGDTPDNQSRSGITSSQGQSLRRTLKALPHANSFREGMNDLVGEDNINSVGFSDDVIQQGNGQEKSPRPEPVDREEYAAWLAEFLNEDGYACLPRKQGFLKKRNRNGRFNKRFFVVNNHYLLYFNRESSYKRTKRMSLDSTTSARRLSANMNNLDERLGDPYSNATNGLWRSHSVKSNKSAQKPVKQKKFPKMAFLDLTQVEGISLENKGNTFTSHVVLTLKPIPSNARVGAKNLGQRSQSFTTEDVRKATTGVDVNPNVLIFKARNNVEAWHWVDMLTKRWNFFRVNPHLVKTMDFKKVVSQFIPHNESEEGSTGGDGEGDTATDIEDDSLHHGGNVVVEDALSSESMSASDAPRGKRTDSMMTDNQSYDSDGDGYLTPDENAEDVYEVITLAKVPENDRDTLPIDYELSLKLFFDLFPCISTQVWMPEGDLKSVVLRAKNYMNDGKKEPAGRSLMKCVVVDAFETRRKVDHIMNQPENRFKLFQTNYSGKVAYFPYRHPGSRLPQYASLALPFLYCLHLQIPSSPPYSVVGYYTPKDFSKFKAILGGDDSRLGELPNKYGELMRSFFLGNDDELRNERFKLIPRLVNAPYVVKLAVPTKPALLGKKLVQRYFKSSISSNGFDNNYLEVSMDIGSSLIAQKVVAVAVNYSKMVVVDMSLLIEGRDSEELPEEILYVYRLSNIDLKTGIKVPWQN